MAVSVPPQIMNYANTVIKVLHSDEIQAIEGEMAAFLDIDIRWYGEPTEFSITWDADFEQYVLKVSEKPNGGD